MGLTEGSMGIDSENSEMKKRIIKVAGPKTQRNMHYGRCDAWGSVETQEDIGQRLGVMGLIQILS